MTFLQISDLHFLRDYASYTGVFRDVFLKMTPPTEQLKLLLNLLEEQPDFAVLSGDLCHESGAADYIALKQKLEALLPGIPLYAIPGNHDHPEAFRRGWGTDTPGVRVIRQEDFSLVFLDSTDPGAPDGLITEENLQALEEALALVSSPAILITHHHLIKSQFALPAAAWPERLPDILSNSPIRAILTGHTHHVFQGRFAGIPYYTTGSLCFRGNNGPRGVLFDEYPAMQVCSLKGDGFEVRPVFSPHPPRPLCRYTFDRFKE